MITRITLLTLILLIGAPALSQDNYKHGPDSMVQEGVPQGTVTKHKWTSKTVFPGTVRDYWIYVPKQYDGKTPAAVMVFKDGHAYVDPAGQFRATVVTGILNHRGVMPVTTGIFIDPGHSSEKLPEKSGWRPRPKGAASRGCPQIH